MCLVLLSFLTSCSDVSDFLFETESTLVVRSVESGALFQVGESFDLSIESTGNFIPDSCQVTIIDEAGLEWGVTKVDIELTDGIYRGALAIPSGLIPGKYLFHIKIFEFENEVSHKVVDLYVVDGEYSIDHLISMPHETAPGKKVYIKGIITSPLGSDPYLRWSINGEVFQEGLLSQGYDSINWLSQKNKGLYGVKLELFPSKGGAGYQSTVWDTTQIFVSGKDFSELNSFSPAQEFPLLFHFNGDLDSDGTSSLNVEGGELIKTSFHKGYMSYQFLEGESFSASGDFIPLEGDIVTPFSLVGRIFFDQSQGGEILNLKNDDRILFSLILRENGRLSLVSDLGETSPDFKFTDYHDFSLAFIPKHSGMELRWFIDGRLLSMDHWENFLPVFGEQTLTVGGETSFYLDELGIYSGDGVESSIDREPFSRYALRQYGATLLYSEGFDDFFERLDGDDLPLFSNSSRVLPAEVNFELYRVGEEEEEEDIGIRLDLHRILEIGETIGNWELRLNDPEGTFLATIPMEPFLTENSGKSSEIDKNLSFILKDKGIFKVVEEGELDLLFPFPKENNWRKDLVLNMRNRDKEGGDLFIDSLVLYKIRKILVENGDKQDVKSKKTM